MQVKTVEKSKKAMKYQAFCKRCKKEVFTYDVNELYCTRVPLIKAGGLRAVKEQYKINCTVCGRACKVNKQDMPYDVIINVRKRG